MRTSCRARAPGAIRAAWVAVSFASCVSFVSCGAAESSPPRVAAIRPCPKWDGFDALGALVASDGPRPSRGHGTGAFVIEVRVSPAQVAAYRALVPGESLPAGTEIAAVHRTQDGAPASVYVMSKLPTAAWDYVVTDPDGSLVSRGALEACIACHQDAPSDSLFGLPHPAPAPLRNAGSNLDVGKK